MLCSHLHLRLAFIRPDIATETVTQKSDICLQISRPRRINPTIPTVTAIPHYRPHYPISVSVVLYPQLRSYPRLPSSAAEIPHRRYRYSSTLESLYSSIRMCWYKRVIFADNHSRIAGVVRKCHLQLAHENGETASSCGKVDFHPVQSIRVAEVCPDCAARLEKQADMLATIKEQLAEAKTKLRLDTDNDRGAIVEEPDAHDGNEAFSPLGISF